MKKPSIKAFVETRADNLLLSVESIIEETKRHPAFYCTSDSYIKALIGQRRRYVAWCKKNGRKIDA